MERVLVNTAAQISETFYQGGVPADPGTVAVAVTSDDGTLVASGNASGTGTAARSFTLTAANTSKLDRLTMTWTSASLGTITTTVEIVGGFLFSANEITGYAIGDVQQARIRAEQTLEQAVGFAFVPRYNRVTLSGLGSSPVRVTKPYLRRVRWGTVAGVALTTTDLAGLSYDSVGQVYGYGFPIGYGNVVLGVEHGWDEPDEPVRAAARELATSYLETSAGSDVDPRAERIITVDGTLVFGTGTTGLPSVDRVIDHYRLPVVA